MEPIKINAIINQTTKRMYKFKTVFDAIEAEGKIPDFDERYERYQLLVVADENGMASFTCKYTDDLQEPTKLGQLDPAVFPINDPEAFANEVFYRFEIVPEQMGYSFKLDLEKEPEVQYNGSLD